ncbi:hypothetical protein C7E18_23795, partial [Stenotrophomonas maltophilia]
KRLLGTLTRLRDLGNTVIVVVALTRTRLRLADYVLDIGPGAGVKRLLGTLTRLRDLGNTVIVVVALTRTRLRLAD